MTDGRAGDRIHSLDLLRGLAVMGIVPANLPAFALPDAAYFSPAAWGGTSPADLAAWFVTFVLIEGKMRALFAMLFGASMLLVVERAEDAGRSGAVTHYRRMAWLFAIGCVHLYALWWGDILAHYALCGAIAYPLRRLSVPALIATALLLVAWQTAQWAGIYTALLHAQAHPDAAGTRLIADLATAFGVPPARDLAAEIAAYRGSYPRILGWRWVNATSPFTLLPALGPETLASMLIGMAGLRSGMLSGDWPRARYVRWAAVALGVSLPVYAAAGLHAASGGFRLADVLFGAMTLAAPLRNLAALGYAALILLLVRPGGWLGARIAATGRAAFSNYLATTLVMTTLFYGYGLGLFGDVSRAWLIPIAGVACTAMLGWSQPWLDRHRYGPAEWLWRSLARGRVEPMLRQRQAT